MPTKRTKVKAGAVALAVAATFSTQSIAEAAANAPVIVVYAMPVLPAGPNTQPVDGRPTLIHDNAAIAAAFNAKGRKVPLDVGHLTEYDGAAPAVGWVRELYVAEDGSLWAWCVMTSEGEALIDGKKFGYTSPTLRVIETDAGWQVMSLKSLALTNNPALEMSATFTAEDDADDEEAEATEQPAEPTTAAAEASESATEGAGTTEAAEAAQTPAEAQPEAPAEEGTAALTATAPAATSAPADEVVALSATVASLTAERDAAAAQVLALSAQLTALTTERDTAVQALATFKAEQTKAEVERVIAEFTAAGKCTPAEHEDLREYAASLGVDKLKTSLSKRVPSAAFTRLSLPAASTDEGPSVPPDVAEYLSQIGGDRLVAAYKRGVSGQ